MGIMYLSLKDFSLDEKIGIKNYSVLHFPKGLPLKQVLKNNNVQSDIKSGRTPSKYNEEYWNGEHEFLTMQDVDTSTFCLKSKATDFITSFAIENEKTLYQAPANSLIVSNAMTIGLAFIVDRPVFINQNVFHVDLDSEKYNLTFLKWYFNLVVRKAFQKTFSSKYYSKDEYARLKLPQIKVAKQNELETKILGFENEIKSILKNKTDVNSIITEIISDELDFDKGEFETLKNEKLFYSTIQDFSGNLDCRMGCRFHNKAGKYLYDFLCSKTDKRVKDFIAEPIVLGKSVSPKDYDEDGEYYYIAMSNIKTWAFEPEDCKKVCEDYSLANQNKTVQKYDILLARSGEGTIGKVALIEDDEIQAIFADFTQRIRLKDYDFKLAYYFFRSEFFQYLVYTHKKGLGNNTNIFPSQIQEFPIPDWSAEKQKEIVDKIQKQIDEQNEIDKQIESKQKEISDLIEKVIAEEANAS